MKPKHSIAIRQALSIGWLALLLGGCSSFNPPQAWEKGALAKPEMTMGGDTLELRFDEHSYASKEAASGGSGVGGGGCGCN
jgi:Domain of unknown function (DUF4266)